MKNLLKVFGVIALIAVIGFSVAACSEPDEGGGGPVFLGDTLELSGDVYTVKYDDDYNPTYTKFTGDLALKSVAGGSGEIKGGQLSYKIETPTGLTAITGLKSQWTSQGYTDITISDETVKIFQFDGIEPSSSTTYRSLYKENETANVSGANYSYTEESVTFVYVDKDVKVTAKGFTETDEGYTEKANDIDLSLKEGWNAILVKVSESGNEDNDTGTYTLSISSGNPDLKWVLRSYGSSW